MWSILPAEPPPHLYSVATIHNRFVRLSGSGRRAAGGGWARAKPRLGTPLGQRFPHVPYAPSSSNFLNRPCRVVRAVEARCSRAGLPRAVICVGHGWGVGIRAGAERGLVMF